MSKQKFTDQDDELLTELGVEVHASKLNHHTVQEERILAGFDEITRFYKKNGREPSMDEEADVFERIIALRLNRLKSLSEYHDLLGEVDKYGLLSKLVGGSKHISDDMTDQELLDELGIDPKVMNSVTKLEHVKPKTQIDPADEVATRTRCPNFDLYKPLFLNVRRELENGSRNSVKYKDDGTIFKGDFYILGGQIAYIADMGADFINNYGRKDSRLKVVYDNGTQTEGMLMRSFQRALNKDGNARRIEPLAAISLFSDSLDEIDSQSGTIYVLRSLSNHPLVIEHRDVIHKIGVTGGDVQKRVTNAKNDPTFLMADVEIVATYRLANINRIKLESLIHKFFSDAQLNIDIKDRFGKMVTVREWFLAPLFVIDEMIEKLRSGTLGEYYYDKETAAIKKI